MYNSPNININNITPSKCLIRLSQSESNNHVTIYTKYTTLLSLKQDNQLPLVEGLFYENVFCAINEDGQFFFRDADRLLEVKNAGGWISEYKLDEYPSLTSVLIRELSKIETRVEKHWFRKDEEHEYLTGVYVVHKQHKMQSTIFLPVANTTIRVY